MARLAHMINPVKADKTSDLFIAQPITFETMQKAVEFAEHRVEVTLLSAQYFEERSMVPSFFRLTDDLDRSVLDISPLKKERKLPLIKDILDRLYKSSNAEFLLYTNVDIALMPFFYIGVQKLIEVGHDAFIINRRTISKNSTKPNPLDLMYAQVGRPHPGYDCFVFKRALYPKFNVGNACIGANWIGKVLATNLIYHSENFKLFENLHLTFHLGDDRSWKSADYSDFDTHNRQELKTVLSQLDLRSLPTDKILLQKFIHTLKQAEQNENQTHSGIIKKIYAILKRLSIR